MSLKHPRRFGSWRCHGGDPQKVKSDFLGHPRRIGQCPACRRWFDVTRSGRLPQHINYDVNRGAQQ